MTKLLRNFMCLLLSIPYSFLVCGDIQGGALKYNLINGLPDIYLVPISEKIGHTWENGNVWDKPLIQKFYSLLAAHDDFFVAIDLGAQTGSFSLLAKYFPNSTWHAFEPLQEAATALKENLILNDIRNVSVYQMAASNFCGQATLKMPTMNEWGLSTLGSNVLRFTPALERKIDCIDLDSFVATQQIKKVHFMKLDTEGSELCILRGAQKTIMRDHPIMIMEYNETNMRQCGALKQDIDDFLTEMGYEWTLISSEDILCIPHMP
jgi:FkbM family methyltransferase